MNTAVSPTRTYVAVCLKISGGYCFRKFVLPEDLTNDSDEASWFYLNLIDQFSVIQGCFSFENFCDVTEVQLDG